MGSKYFYKYRSYISDSDSTPLRFRPLRYLDFYYKDDGKLYSRRKFDISGKAKKDLDLPTAFHPFYHVHDFKYIPGVKNPIREKYRFPNLFEKLEFLRIKHKKYFYNK